MNEMNIISAKYIKSELSPESVNSGIKAIINGVELCIPLDPANRHYAAIMELVNAGTLTIAEADE